MPPARSIPDPASLPNPYDQVLASTGSHFSWASGIIAAAVVVGVTGLAGSAHADPDDTGVFGVLDDTDAQFGITSGADLDLPPGGGTGWDGDGDGGDDLDDLFTDPDADLSFGPVELDTTGFGTSDLVDDGVAAGFNRDQRVDLAESPFPDIDRPAPGSATTDPTDRDVDNTLGIAVPDTGPADDLAGGLTAGATDDVEVGGDGTPGTAGSGTADVVEPDHDTTAAAQDGGPPPLTTTVAAPDPDDSPAGGSEPDDQPVEPDVTATGGRSAGAVGARLVPANPGDPAEAPAETAPERPAAVDQPEQGGVPLPAQRAQVTFATATAEQIAADAEVEAARSRDLPAERGQLDQLVTRLGDILPRDAEFTHGVITSAAGTQRRVDGIADGSDPYPLHVVDHGAILDGTVGRVRELAAALGDPEAVPRACSILVDLQCQAGDRPLQNGEDVVRRIAKETQPLRESGQHDAAARLAVLLMGEDFLDRGTLVGNAVRPDEVLATLLGTPPREPLGTAAALAGTTTVDPLRVGTLMQLRTVGPYLLPATVTTQPFNDAVDGLLNPTTEVYLTEPQARVGELVDAAERGDVFAACSAYIGLVSACGGVPQDRADAAIAAVGALGEGSPEVRESRTLTPDEVGAYEVTRDAVFRDGAMTSVSGDLVSPRNLSAWLDPLFRTDGVPAAGSVARPAGAQRPRTTGPDITAGPSGVGPGGTEDDADATSLPNWIQQSGLPPNAFSGNVIDPTTGQVYAGGDTGFLLLESDFDRDVIAAHTGSRTAPSGLAPLDADEQRRWAELFGTGDFTVLDRDPDYVDGQRSVEARGDEDDFESGRLLWNELPLLATENPGAATLELLAAHSDLEELLERARTGQSDDAGRPFSSNEVARQAELASLQGRMQNAQPMDTITMAACQIDLLACTGEITPDAAAAARARIDEAASEYDRGIELARNLVPDSRFGSRYPEVDDLTGTVSRLFGDNSVADAAAARVLPEVHPYRGGTSSYGSAPLPGILPDGLTHLQIHPHEYRALLGDTISPRELANLEGAVQSYMSGAQALGYDSGGSGGPNVLPNAEQRARGLAQLEESLARYRTISRAEGFDSPGAVAAFGHASDLAAELRTAMLGEPPAEVTPRTFELDDPVPGDVWNRAEMGALVALWQAGGGGRSFDTFALDTLGSSRIDDGNVPRQFVFSTHRPPTGLEEIEDFEETDEIEAGGSAAASRVTAGATVPSAPTGQFVSTDPSAGGDEQGTAPQEVPGGQAPPAPAEGTRSSPGGVTVGGGLGRPVSREEAAQAMFPGGNPNRADPPTAAEQSLTPPHQERVEFDPNSLNQPGEPAVIPELTGIPMRDPGLEAVLYPNGLAGPRHTFPAGAESADAGEPSPALQPGRGSVVVQPGSTRAGSDGRPQQYVGGQDLVGDGRAGTAPGRVNFFQAEDGTTEAVVQSPRRDNGDGTSTVWIPNLGMSVASNPAGRTTSVQQVASAAYTPDTPVRAVQIRTGAHTQALAGGGAGSVPGSVAYRQVTGRPDLQDVVVSPSVTETVHPDGGTTVVHSAVVPANREWNSSGAGERFRVAVGTPMHTVQRTVYVPAPAPVQEPFVESAPGWDPAPAEASGPVVGANPGAYVRRGRTAAEERSDSERALNRNPAPAAVEQVREQPNGWAEAGRTAWDVLTWSPLRDALPYIIPGAAGEAQRQWGY